MTMPQSRWRTRAPFRVGDAGALASTVAWLRPFALAGQLAAVLVVVELLQVSLPLTPLLGGIALLGLATLLAFWRLGKPWPVHEVEAGAHVVFDILLLGWALYFTGGATNPFITLLLVPVALSAAALSYVGTAVITLLATAVYGLLVLHNVPLPDIGMGSSGFRLHLAGMAVNFVVAVVLVAIFVGRMRGSLHAQREATRVLRERALRDEGVLAIATQAADAAHRLNTPLSTLRTLLPEIARAHAADTDLCGDLQVMDGEVERCRKILRGMVDYGRGQLVGEPQQTTLEDYVRDSADRFALLRPEAELSVDVPPRFRTQRITVQPALGHALFNLMQNASDASLRNGSGVVSVAARVSGGRVEFTISDRGGGFSEARVNSLPFVSEKPNGLGLGFALARTTVERLRGTVVTHSDANGTRVLVRLPLLADA